VIYLACSILFAVGMTGMVLCAVAFADDSLWGSPKEGTP
jgi:hypothetical protein